MNAVLLEARITSTDATDGNNNGGPRQQWIDISFPSPNPVQLSYICFHNYYSAAITISHTTTRADGDPLTPAHHKGRSPAWQVVVPKLTLMVDPHYEDDAQKYHELSGAHFAKDFDTKRVTRLRICCLQPSPLWKEYGLHHLRFYSIEAPPAPSVQPPPSLTPAERDLAATMVEQLIGLGSIASQIRTTVASGVAASSAARRQRPSRGGGSVGVVVGGVGGSGGVGSGGGGGGSDLDGISVGGGSAGGASSASARDPPTFAPYIVGEWADELRLLSIDCPGGGPSAAHSARPSSAKVGGRDSHQRARPQSAAAGSRTSSGQASYGAYDAGDVP